MSQQKMPEVAAPRGTAGNHDASQRQGLQAGLSSQKALAVEAIPSASEDDISARKGLKRKQQDRDEQVRIPDVHAAPAEEPHSERSEQYVNVEIALRGLNVRPYFADLLVRGVKAVECRKYMLGTRGTGRTTFVIRSKGSDKHAVPAVVGMLRFHGCIEYTSRDQYEQDRAKHCIDASSEFEWLGPNHGTMYAWCVDKYYAFESAIPVDQADMPRRNIIGWCKPVALKVKVKKSEKDAIMNAFCEDD